MTRTIEIQADHAADLLDRMAQKEVALRALKAGELGVLRLASFATVGAELVPPALATVRQAIPTLEIGLRVADCAEALGLLRNGQVDVAVIEAHDPVAATDGVLKAIPLLVDPFRIVVPREHRLAARRVIPLGDAAKEPWIAIKCEIGCCRTATGEAFEQAGFTPRRTVEAGEYWPAQGFVAAGLGLALIPALALGVQHHGVAVRRIHRSHQPERQVFAVTRTAISETHTVRTMTTALQAQASSQQARK